MSSKIINRIFIAALTCGVIFIAGIFVTNIHGSPMWLRMLTYALTPAELVLPGRWGIYDMEDAGFGFRIDVLNSILHFLLIAGAVMFKITNGNETRLVRFYFSIAFICQVLFALIAAIFLFVPSEIKYSVFQKWGVGILYVLVHSALAYGCYKILSAITHSKKLKITTSKQEDGEYSYLTDASNWQRFFHLIIDLFICVTVVLNLHWLQRINFYRTIDSQTEGRLVLWLLIVVMRTLYYVFFESILGGTPAKFLTETRVTNYEGEKNKVSTILGRSLCRSIPFEPFSFFFNGKWHDKISHTYVLKEERRGYKAIFYLWFIIAMALSVGGLYFGVHQYGKYKAEKRYKEEIELKLKTQRDKLKKLTTDFIIEAKGENDYSHTYYFKVEAVTPSVITVSKIDMSEVKYSESVEKATEAWRQQKDALKRFDIPRTVFEKMIPDNFEASQKNSGNNYHTIFAADIKYEIKDFVRMSGPRLNQNFSSFSHTSEDNAATIHFINEGDAAIVANFISVEGGLAITTPLPLKINKRETYSSNRFELSFKNYEYRKEYKFILVLEDEAHKQYKYLVKSNNSSLNIFEIFE